MVGSVRAARARYSVLALATVGVLALGACGSSSSKSESGGGSNTKSSTGSGGTSGSSGSTALCKKLTADDAAKLFGEAATTASGTNAGLATEQCLYKNTNRAVNHPYWLLQARHYTQPAVFDSNHIAYKTYTNLSGIGDAAFVAPDALGHGYTIEVKKGNDVYTFDLSVSNIGGTTPDVSKTAFIAAVKSTVG